MLDEEMEKAVFDWIGVMRASTLCVSRRMIKAKAKDHTLHFSVYETRDKPHPPIYKV